MQAHQDELQSFVDHINTSKTERSHSVREIADKYLLIAKSIKAELSAVKEMAAGQITEAS